MSGGQSKDFNDILREGGEDAARAFHDAAENFDESNPKFQNGKASEHGAFNGDRGDGGTIPDLGERDAGDDVELPPPRQWLLGNQFCRKFLSGLVAPGSTGKSAVRLAQCLSLATGRSLTDQHVFKRCRVLIVSLEDDAEEMRRRILAARLHYDISLDDVKGWLFYATPKGMKLAEMRGGSREIGQLEKSLRAAIERRRPDLVVLDPYVKLHALEENDNGAMDFVYQFRGVYLYRPSKEKNKKDTVCAFWHTDFGNLVRFGLQSMCVLDYRCLSRRTAI